ncbi:MAG: hypothetical protein M3295_10555 [Chloroflexota bacterium]|nr:hypothetical protein [Chloroflexota bacterium]
MRAVAWRVFLAFVIGLAVLTAGMFAFVLAVTPPPCEEPSCLAEQTYSPGASVVELPPTVEPSESGVPAPPVVPIGSASASPAP